MSKLTRKNIKVFGGNSSNTGKFGSAVAGSGVLTSDIETIQSLAAWDNGMASATIGGQKLLPQEEMEGMMRVATYGLANIYQDGIPVYNSATPYYIGSIVRQDNTTILYKSLVNDNVGNVLTDDTKWVELGDLANITTSLTPIATSSTASATAEKAVTISGVTSLAVGQEFLISCTNANTASIPTVNINSLGAKNLIFKDGIAVDATHPAPINLANRYMRVIYDGTYFIIQKNAKYDSGWFSVVPNTTYTKTHNLGTNQIKYTILIADDALGTNCRPSNDYYYYNYGTTEPRNYITNETTSTTLSFTTYAHVGNAISGGGVVTSGYYRIIAEAL